MSKLYIIGNGFDRAHGLDTEYKHFRRYLLENEETFLYDLEKLYGYPPFNSDVYHFSLNRQEEIQKQHNEMIENWLWTAFEDNLGKPDEGEIQSICEAAGDSLKNIEFGVIEDTLNAHYEDQFRFIERLQEYLLAWAKQIDLGPATIKRKVLRNNTQDWFFSFNYTPVLEKIYGISNSRICHIHGGILPIDQHNRPIIGHGNRTSIEQHEKWQKESSDQFDEIGSSMNRAFVNFYQRTYKDVDRAMAHHAEFFKHLKHLDEILVIGHSVNIIDIQYYIKIHKNNPTVTWNVYYHRDSEKTEMESALKGIGITNLNMIPAKDFWDQ